MHTLLQRIAPPSLPLAGQEYTATYQDQLNNVLRLYFNQLTTILGAITGENGGQYIDCPNGLIFNTDDQTFAAPNTAYPIVYNVTYLSNAVQLKSGSSSQIEVLVGGVYNFQYTGQVLSTSASAKTMDLWIRRNGIDIPYSNRARTVAANNQYTPVTWNFNIDLAAGEYVELMAAVTDVALYLDAMTAVAPHPGTSSSVMTVNFIAPLPDERPTPPTP